MLMLNVVCRVFDSGSDVVLWPAGGSETGMYEGGYKTNMDVNSWIVTLNAKLQQLSLKIIRK